MIKAKAYSAKHISKRSLIECIPENTKDNKTCAQTHTHTQSHDRSDASPCTLPLHINQYSASYRVGKLQAGIDQRDEVIVQTGFQTDDVLNDVFNLQGQTNEKQSEQLREININPCGRR